MNTFDYDPATDRYTPAAHDTELEPLGIAFFQTAYELFERGDYLPSLPDSRMADKGQKP